MAVGVNQSHPLWRRWHGAYCDGWGQNSYFDSSPRWPRGVDLHLLRWSKLWLTPVFALVSADVHRTSASKSVRLPPISHHHKKTPPISGGVFLWWSRGESFAFLPEAKINVRLRPAVGGNTHPRCIYMIRLPNLNLTKKDTTHFGWCLFWWSR